MENNGARIHGMMLSAFCSLMLGSTLISAHAGVSMAAIGGSFGAEKVTNELVTAGWAVPAPAEHAVPKMGAARTVSTAAPAAESELEPIVRKIQTEGQNTFIEPKTSKILGLTEGEAVPIKAKAVKVNNRLRAVGVFTRESTTYVFIMDRDAETGSIYLAGVDGRMARGFFLSRGVEPKPINPTDPDFAAQKTFWKTQLANTSVASISGS